MMIVNNKFLFFLVLLVLAGNAKALGLCANGNENTAMVATTPAVDFIDNGDGTVTHHKTGLIWQRCSLGQIWDGSQCIGGGFAYSWFHALVVAKQNDFAGFNDWRLPNKNELASIVEYRCSNPAINSQQFPNTPSGSYWSSSPNALNNHKVWIASFSHAGIYGGAEYYSRLYVRLVRDPLGEPSGEPSIEIINGSPENRKEDSTTGQ